MERYFVICNSDGDTTVDCLTKEELLERLDPEDSYYGNGGYLKEISDTDTNYWGEKVLIIKGEVVVPKEVKVVTEIDID